MDPVVEAAWIQTAGTVFASLVAAGIAGWYGKRWLDQEQLAKQLKTARSDIAFLLEVEKSYVQRTRDVDQVGKADHPKRGRTERIRVEWPAHTGQSQV